MLYKHLICEWTDEFQQRIVQTDNGCTMILVLEYYPLCFEIESLFHLFCIMCMVENPILTMKILSLAEYFSYLLFILLQDFAM